ncbi:AraC family transcriptional regulator [Bacillus subtilis]|uniref:AraC family transcriptional regulator n=1 Tax=Bacillus subtilis TaxID=1423 RepID=UPI001B9F87A9|nr:AraC family transcriptional regulator [Bacillus subtilis]WAE49124.1 transcriptional regulator YesS [Bacillus subtilis]CAF1839595.1 HTH-type transcriptional regulator YesS [Bacillus subtilis]CAI6236533.1 transcriptional regulator YesS [Bacillus subtilis]
MKKQPQQKERVSRWKGRYFKRNFVFILLIACIPGLLTGGAIYFLSIDKVEKELQRSHETQVAREVSRMDEKLGVLELALTQMAYDSSLMNGLAERDLEKDFTFSYQLTKKLFLLRDQQPLIEQASIFLNSPRPLVLSPEYSALTEQEALRKYRSLLASDHSIYWKRSGNQAMLIQLIPGAAEKPFGAIMLAVDPKEMESILQSLSPYPDGSALLLDQNQEVLFHEGEKDFKKTLLQEIKKQPAEKGHIQMEWEGKVYSVSFGEMNRMHQQWTFVSAAPLSAITAPMVFLSKVIIVMLVICIGLAVCMTWYASKKIYRPIQHLLGLFTGGEKKVWQASGQDEFKWIEKRWQDLSLESRKLQEQLLRQTPHMKKSFLQHLLQGDFYYDNEDSLRSRMEEAGWNIGENVFHVLDLQLTGLRCEKSIFCCDDEQLAVFTLTNIAEELADKRVFQLSILDIGRLSVTVLVMKTNSSDLKAYITELARQFGDVTGLCLTSTLSSKTERVTEIPSLFQDVKCGKSRRKFANRDQVIDLQADFPQDEQFAPYYPFELEKQIVQAIRLERKQEAKELIDGCMRELAEKAAIDRHVHSALIQLFSRIQEDILHSGLNPSELFQHRNPFLDISELREPNEAAAWLMDVVVTPYLSKLEGRKNRQQKQLAERVIAMIHEQYMADISLESCADALGMNSYTLSKAFKQVTGINFIDYVTQIRIEKAKELLVNTNKKIHDVSEEVGYRHNYFNRIFKKQVGMPPGVFRQMYQETP